MAALTEISVGGATQTGAHGSGLTLANLATHIRSMQLVLGNGTIAEFGPDAEELKALSVGLGAFGVITQLELNLVPAYNVTVYGFAGQFLNLFLFLKTDRNLLKFETFFFFLQ